jgi:hypothetical protein
VNSSARQHELFVIRKWLSLLLLPCRAKVIVAVGVMYCHHSSSALSITSSVLWIGSLYGLHSIVAAMQATASDAARKIWSKSFSIAMMNASAASGLRSAASWRVRVRVRACARALHARCVRARTGCAARERV